ncbi:MAG: nucleotide sugar dehydrogenase [Acidobacteria bacterium]|nr:nucleotide sugar dehydrogenase [Acidobacteriota bacterium]
MRAATSVHGDLIERLRARQARVGVIGLGYVGLPLLVELAGAGFDATGIDVDVRKVEAIGRGESYIADVAAADLSARVRDGRLRATSDFSVLRDLDTVNICVPTPLRKTKDPDLSYIVSAVEEIAKYLHKGQLVVLESTTYPGTTDEVVQPMLEAGGLEAGVDFFLAFSPERVDPGNARWNTRNIPKVVGGINEASTEVATALYAPTVGSIVPVSSTKVAEMVKLLENTFRAVNIGLVNELALMCHGLGVDVWEVIDAAKTKPFGFMPFYPGFESRFIELAGHVNATMPRYVVERVSEALNSVGKPVRGSRVHLFGMAYKSDVNDSRESPAIDVAQLLLKRGAIVTYSDPFVPQIEHGDLRLRAEPQEEALAAGVDCAVITTHHSAFDYAQIARRAPVVVDTRNALKGIPGAHIFRL